jgi:hypothetical protein
VAGGQRGGKGDNECYSETKKNQIWGMLTGVRPVLITPEIKTANEIACDRVWNKLYPSPIYVTLL